MSLTPHSHTLAHGTHTLSPVSRKQGSRQERRLADREKVHRYICRPLCHQRSYIVYRIFGVTRANPVSFSCVTLRCEMNTIARRFGHNALSGHAVNVWQCTHVNLKSKLSQQYDRYNARSFLKDSFSILIRLIPIRREL